MKKDFHWILIANWQIFFEILLFLAVQFLGLNIFIRYALASPYTAAPTSSVSQLIYILIIIAVGTVVMLLLAKKRKSVFLIKGLFYIAVIEGVWLYADAFFSWPTNIAVTLILMALYVYYHNIIMHNIVLLFTAASLGALLGGFLNVTTAIILLCVMIAYDYIAVYRTKHMVTMFKGLVEKKVYFAYIFPYELKRYTDKVNVISDRAKYIFLGTGDVVFPLILAVAALRQGTDHAYAVIWGATIGLIALYYVFIFRKQGRPMPGLPFIAGGALIGYISSLL